MNVILKLCGVGAAGVMLITGPISADANIGRGDNTAANNGNSRMHVALNPQPLPPRCLPPGCKNGGGGIRAKPAVRFHKPPHAGDDWQQRRQ